MANLSSKSAETGLSSNVHRMRVIRDPLRRELIWLFYLIFWLGLFWVLIDTLPFRLTIPLGSSQLREIDLVVFAFFVVWIVRMVVRHRALRNVSRAFGHFS